MINHISIGVHDPEKVANFLAVIWNGYVFPFPPSPESFIVVADDGRGSAVEVTPVNIVLEPGVGFPSEDGFDKTTPTEEFEASFVYDKVSPKYISTHLAINTSLSEAQVKELANREGWRTLTCNRGEGLFQLIEIWVENRFMLEVFTPEMTARYVEIMNPQIMAEAMGKPLNPKPFQEISSLDLVG